MASAPGHRGKAREPAKAARAAPALTALPGGAVNAHAAEPDALLHHHVRLGIVSALAGTESLSFVELRALLDTSDGNLSVHARKLEDAGYIACDKHFAERRPRSDYRLTAAGKRQLAREQSRWDAVVRTVARVMRPSEGG